MSSSTSQLANKIQTLIHSGRLNDAEDILKSECTLVKMDADLTTAAGQIALQKGDIYQSVVHFNRAVKLKPNTWEFLNNLALINLKTGRPDLAVNAIRKSAKLNPRNAETLKIEIEALFALNKIEQAKSKIENAMSSGLRNVHVLVDLARMHRALGQNNKALKIYRDISNSPTATAGAIFGMAQLVDKHDPYPEASIVNTMIERGDLPPDQMANLHRATAIRADQISDYAIAFKHHEMASQIISHGRDGTQRLRSFLTHARKNFTKENISKAQKHTSKSTKPVFIFGMPRTGTTLVEQIISANEVVHAGGEIDFFNHVVNKFENQWPDRSELKSIAKDYLTLLKEHGGTKSYITNKLPGNFQHLWIISALFPNAKLIFCQRDPCATCTSCLTTSLGTVHDYVGSQKNLADYYKMHLQLMNFWKANISQVIHHVQYERLVKYPKTEIKSLAKFLGIDATPEMFNFHTSNRPIQTPSIDQVRRPMDTGKVSSWRRYEPFLQELIIELSKT